MRSFKGCVSSVCVVCALMVVGVACGPDESTSTGGNNGGTTTPDQGSFRMDMEQGGGSDQAPDARDQGEVVLDMSDMQPGQVDMASDQGGVMPGDMGEREDMAMEDMAMLDMGQDPVDMSPPEDMAMEDMAPTLDVYVGNGDVFMPGSLQVSKSSVTVQPDDTKLSLWYPSMAGSYAVIVFQHGFLMDTAYYDTMLTHIASHGFIVAAPQMYAPGDNPFGKPSSAEEAMVARAIWQGLAASLPASLPTGVEARADLLGVAGHSRGAKVIWRNLIADPSLVKAAVGVDPVDGGGGFGGDPAALPSGGVNFSLPVLFIGAGLGPVAINAFAPACAPAQDGYLSFYAASKSPAYEVVATEYGHLDMLEDQPSGCGFTCSACTDGSGPRSAMRRASAGWIVALMRSVLQGSDNALNVLTSPALAPVTTTARSK